jgi:hypothetical protein
MKWGKGHEKGTVIGGEAAVRHAYMPPQDADPAEVVDQKGDSIAR